MVNLFDSNITDILPDIFKHKPEVKALGYAIQRATQRLIEYCQHISVYSVLDTVPEDILDLLAIELNTQYYDDTMDIDTKRALIKNTFIWYENTGTPAAVQELVETVFGNGTVEEWFNYDGDPYCFRVYTENINSTDEMLQQLETMINNIQNIRSHLDYVTVEVMEQLPVYGGCVIETIGDCITLDIDMDI